MSFSGSQLPVPSGPRNPVIFPGVHRTQAIHRHDRAEALVSPRTSDHVPASPASSSTSLLADTSLPSSLSPGNARAVANDQADLEALPDRAARHGTAGLVIDQPGSIAQLALAVAARRACRWRMCRAW